MRAIFVFCKQTAVDVNMLGRFLILDLQMNSMGRSYDPVGQNLICRFCDNQTAVSAIYLQN